MEKLNLGCGNDIIPDAVNLDYKKIQGVNKVHNLNKFPYPFKENTFNEVICHNLLEHLEDPIKTLNEIKRITKNKGTISIIVPHFSCADTWGNLEHKRGYSTQSFTENLPKGLILKKIQIIFPRRRSWVSRFANRYNGIYEHNLAFILPAQTINVILEVNK